MNQDKRNVCEKYEDQHSITKGTFLYSRFFLTHYNKSIVEPGYKRFSKAFDSGLDQYLF